ncbi:unnamed protein product [Enterobius vermicularis]|uniref:Uncharacterized protein n=1 Tax=Enterobius vermicularis TaxID=51028 RepID=A0A3P6I2A0_ENTVE|nr:unnamed protein product [Enterobius vermicularis]
MKQIFAKGLEDFELREEAWRLCANYVGGIWKEVSASDIIITVPPGGLNNFIFIVSVPENFLRVAAEPTMVVLRIYFSEDIDTLLAESVISVTLSERGVGPTVLGVFRGGRIEEFIQSRIITNKELCNIHYYYPCSVGYEVGKILAAVHSLNVGILKENRFDSLIDGMVKRLRHAPRWDKPQKMRTTQAKWEDNLFPPVLTVDLLAEEFELAKQCLACSGSPIVFSNNDLHVTSN